MVTRSNHRATAVLLLAQVAILIGGYFVLQAAFDFPDILREPAADRLTLFASKESIIIPTYWIYAMTGLLQVAFSVMLWRVSRVRDTALGQLAVVFGILTGVFQVMGFIRWVVVIPVLADALKSGTPAASVDLIESVLNAYGGMAVGEHLGFMSQATWCVLLGLSLLKSDVFDHKVAWAGVGIGAATYLVAIEPLSSAFETLAPLSIGVSGAFLIWLFVLGVSLLRTEPEVGRGPTVGWKTGLACVVFWAVAAAPGMFS
jgi:hypothetical protein